MIDGQKLKAEAPCTRADTLTEIRAQKAEPRHLRHALTFGIEKNEIRNQRFFCLSAKACVAPRRIFIRTVQLQAPKLIWQIGAALLHALRKEQGEKALQTAIENCRIERKALSCIKIRPVQNYDRLI